MFVNSLALIICFQDNDVKVYPHEMLKVDAGDAKVDKLYVPAASSSLWILSSTR